MTRCVSYIVGPRASVRGLLLLLTLVMTGSASLRAEEFSGLQVAGALEEALVDAIAQGEKSVVAIARVNRNGQEVGPQFDLRQDPFGQRANLPARPVDPEFIPNEYATGVVVGAGGLILTAYHVLHENSDYYVTTADRRVYRVSAIVGADPRSDLAVLSIAAQDLTPVKFGDAGKLKKGQIVISLGNPYAIARDGQASASWGIISNLSRKDGPSIPDHEAPSGKRTLHQYGTLIQTDAKLNLGTSGGALLNLRGEMIGLTVALAATLGYEQPAGFALPVDETFRRALDALKQGREVEYGFLGVSLEALTDTERVRGRHGVRVREVIETTPADRSGLAHGDVITRVGDQDIYDSDQLMLCIGKLPVDGQVTVTVEREGQGTRVIAIPELAKYGVPGKKIITNLPPAWRGIRVDYVTAARDFQLLAQQRRVDPHGAVVITEVEENSPAWNEGLRADMTISHVGGRPVKTPKEFHEAIANKQGPVDVRLNLPANQRPVRTIPQQAG